MMNHFEINGRDESEPFGKMQRNFFQAFFISTIFLSAAWAEDWKKIARETDEPAFGEVIEHVSKGDQADAFGLKKGDFIFQLDTQSLRGFGLKRKNEEQSLFYVPKGGEITLQTIQPGKVGCNSRGIFRPWLAYLREQIGTRNDQWDDAVVSALVSLEEDPESAIDQWKQVAALGYPEDDLDGMVKVRSDLLLGNPIRLESFWKQVQEIGDEVPPVYLGTLEDSAIASGNLPILRALQKADPSSFQIEEDILDLWEEVGGLGQDSPIKDLKSVKERHGKNVTRKIAVFGEKSKDSTAMRDQFVRKWPSLAEPGNYVTHKVMLPAKLNDFHVTTEICSIAYQNSTSWVNLVRMDLQRTSGEGKKHGTGTLASIGLGRELGQEGAVYYRAGLSRKLRETQHPKVKIPQITTDFENSPRSWDLLPKLPELSRPIRMDIVAFGKEVAVFADGVCYARVPRSEEKSELAIQLTVSGSGMRMKDFAVFELSDAPAAETEKKE